MALVRILVDGYSLLHQWTDLVPGRPRHSAAAREALIHRLTSYQDACGTPVTIVFDGSANPDSGEEPAPTREVEIIYTHRGQTADQVIERAAYRFVSYGEVLVVTDDAAERETVLSLGGTVWSCQQFIRTVDQNLNELEQDIRNFNQRERADFNRTRAS